MSIQIQPLDQHTRQWSSKLVRESFGATSVVSRGVVHETSDLPGLVALIDGQPQGVLHYHIAGVSCEVVTLIAVTSGLGIGTALLAAAISMARQCGCSRIWLITTNDNHRAQRFYAARGWQCVAVHRGAVTAARALKPAIPLLGDDGIPIEDEHEYALNLAERTTAMRLEHVAINVAEPDAMAEWYCTNLGMQVVRHAPHPNHTYFLADSSRQTVVEIYRNPAAAVPEYAQIAPLMLHFAFVSSAIEADLARLEAAGARAATAIETTPTGDRLVFLRDPWHVTIQLVQRVRAMLAD